MARSKAPALMPGWLGQLYRAYGDPLVRPDPWAQGVRFFDGERTVQRRTWVWRHDKTHYKLYINQYRDGYETVVEKFADEGFLTSTDTHASLRTQLHPSDEQIESLLTAAGFER